MSSESPEALLAHSSFVHALASRLVFDREDAEDVAQDTWVSYLRSRPDASRPLEGWFRRVVQNHALQHRRGSGRRDAREQAVARPEGLPSTDEIVERENARRAVIDALVALREPYRATILLRFYEDLSPAEVAERLGVPLETVRTRLKRGLALLRERLDARSGGREQWTLALLPLALPRGASLEVSRQLARGADGAWRAKLAALLGVVLVALFFGRWLLDDAGAVDAASADSTVVASPSALSGPDVAQAATGFERLSVAPEPRVQPWRVSVVRDLDGLPLAELDVDVRIAGREAERRRTDEFGRLAFAVPVGRGVLLATAGSDAALGGELALAPLEAADVDGALEAREVAWTLPAASSVAGRVLDAAGAPAGGSTVTLFRDLRPFVDAGSPVDPAATVVTDSDGRFEFRGLPQEFSVIATRGDEVAIAGLSAQLERPAAVADVELTLAPAWRVRGRITDPRGNPLADVELGAANHDRRGRGRSAGHAGVSYRTFVRQRVRSGADGRFEFAALAATAHEVRATRAGYVEDTRSISGPTDELDFVLHEGVELVARVLGRAGTPLAGATVRVLGPSSDPRTELVADADGRVVLSLAREQRGFLRASAPGYATSFGRPFSLADSSGELVLELEPSQPIVGRVVDADGAPVAECDVQARLAGEYVAELRELWVPKLDASLLFARARTDSNGEFVLDGTDGREYELGATPPGATSARAVARVAGGQTGVELELDARAENTLSFRGRLHSRLSGVPIEYFRVVAQRVGVQGSRVVAARNFREADGEFRLFAGRPGTWWLWVRAEGYAPLFVAPREYPAGEAVLDYPLDRAATIDVHVVDARGAAVQGARVICSESDGTPLPTMISSSYWLNSVPCDTRGVAALVGVPARAFRVEVRVPELNELFGFDVDPTIALDRRVELALPVDLTSPRRPLELSLLTSADATPAGEFSGEPVSAPPWVGRCTVRVLGARGAVTASFAGVSDARGFQLEKPFTYFVVSVDGGSKDSHVFLETVSVDPAGLRDGPELLAPGRLRIAIPFDAVLLEVLRDGQAPFHVPLEGRGESGLLLRLPSSR
ncbi:MAG: sigma-70 family RNA polymerase sigma factor [Planctomycetes bacterium]|nr:sigma-70 family RNA polymerase sigma factor [Planctomycetota bacterium]